MNTQNRNGNFVEIERRKFAPTFEGSQPRSVISRRSLRATRRANRAV